MTKYKIGYFVGSLSSTSINRKLAHALAKLAPPELELVEIPIKDLPLYSQDYDADFPEVAKAFKQAIADCDGLLFVTPEFNRSIPGGLKNAIDWASRPWGRTLLPASLPALSAPHPVLLVRRSRRASCVVCSVFVIHR
ncbi:NADPH-dependent FMN reductase [Vibrio fluvialis]|uniref:NADPH-dependent FMN reductase n=1 Tax=Vibrio fluvialis TaxID=676 RepID=UPI001EEC76AD|nr:NADPH-dependent FMN reductase [Vibrio fluvialis]